MAVEAQLLVGAQVKQPAGGVVGACGEGAAVGEKLRRSADIGVRLRGLFLPRDGQYRPMTPSCGFLRTALLEAEAPAHLSTSRLLTQMALMSDS